MRKGSHQSPETRQKMSLAHRGAKASEETKRKLSEARKGEGNAMFGRTGDKHPRFGTKHSEETKEKMREKALGENNPMYGTHCNTAEDNGMWKGDEVGYHAIHLWIRARKPKPEYCESCNEAAPYDLANISGQYSRALDDWEWLCRKCHMESDGRLAKLIEARIRRSIEDEIRRDAVTARIMKKVDIDEP